MFVFETNVYNYYGCAFILNKLFLNSEEVLQATISS